MNPATAAEVPGLDPALVRQQRKAFYDAISGKSMKPLWEVLHSLVPS